MSITTSAPSSNKCGYCGNFHNYGPEMCRDMHNRPPAPATGNICPSSWPVIYTLADVDKLKADHLAELAEKDKVLESKEKALDNNEATIRRLSSEITHLKRLLARKIRYKL
jgi:hypothetical protein